MTTQPDNHHTGSFSVVLEAEEKYLLARRDALQQAITDEAKEDAAANPGGPARTSPPSPSLYTSAAPVGLAVSGGGIRSATFCLGVLQLLAHRRLLKYVDYLSTVSGGGFIGSALSWFLLGAHGFGRGPAEALGIPFGVGPKDFPFGATSPRHDIEYAAEPRLTWLRNRGLYLTPGDGIGLSAGIAVVVRGIVLNVVVWLPWVSLVMLSALAAAGYFAPVLAMTATTLCATLLDPIVALVATADANCCVEPRTKEAKILYAFFVLALGLLLLGCLAFVIGCILYSFAAAKICIDDNERYRFRRKFEILGGKILIWLILAPAVLLTLPVVHQWIAAKGAISLITSGGLAGIWSFVRTSGKESDNENKAFLTNIISCLGALLILYGFGLLGFTIAVSTLASDAKYYWFLGLGICFFLAVVSGYFVNINLIGLHRFYRDRLMEAFLPDRETKKSHRAVAADAAMIQDFAKEGSIAPYHIVNTNLITVQTQNRTRRLRGGDNFILTPRYCGSAATGWCKSEHYLHGAMSLATAMAISGAAANPNAGCGGGGSTRSWPVALLMSLLNIRLGYFVPNPDSAKFNRYSLSKRANHYTPGFTAAMSALLNFGNDEDRSWLQLSDGGHFDNSGLYELFRRKVKLAIACDGSADPGYAFADMLLALERARLDFGIRWVVDKDTPLGDMAPQSDLHFPIGGKCAPLGYMLAQIWYPNDAVPGLLIYMTTTLILGLDEHVLGYRADNPSFPDQSTGDQFFDDRQFEAYRVLGWSVAEQMVDQTQIAPSEDKQHLVVRRARNRIVS